MNYYPFFKIYDDNYSFSELLGYKDQFCIIENDIQNNPIDEPSINEPEQQFLSNNKPKKNDTLLNKNNPFLTQSTNFISKINNFPEKNNEEVKENKIIKENSLEQFIKEENQNFIGNKTRREDKEKNNYGRKKKDSEEIGAHTKYNEDNIIAKIKNYIFNSARNSLNNSFIFPNPKRKLFFRLELGNYNSIKKDINLQLLNTKLKDIFSDISLKYYSNKDKNHNISLIQKIYEEEKETDIIKILELTFGELLNIFRGTISDELQEKISHITHILEKFGGMSVCIHQITVEGKKNGETEENIKKYTDKFKDLTMNLEKWFNEKTGRRSNKRKSYK